MKNKKAFRKAILPALAMLVASIVSLSSVTYAWFTAGTSVSVDQIDINVQAAGGLQVAVNAAKTVATENPDSTFQYGSMIRTDQLTSNGVAYDLTGKTLRPASTIGTLTGNTGSKTIEMYEVDYDDSLDKISNSRLIDQTTADGKGAFVAFDLYLKNPAAETKLVDILGTTVKSATGNSQNAVRIAFIQQSSISSTIETVKANDTKLFNSGTASVKIYEPNATLHTTNGYNDYNTYNGTSYTATTGVFNYRGVKAASLTGKDDILYNRYTGQGFDPLDNSNLDDDDDGRIYSDTDFANISNSDWYVYQAPTAERKGETFRKWVINDDYAVAVSGSDAAKLYANGVELFIGEDTKDADGTLIADERYGYNRTKEDKVFESYHKIIASDFEAPKNFTWDVNATYYRYAPVQLYTTVDDEILDTQDTSKGEEDEYTHTETSDSTVFFTLGATTVTKVTVYVWVEGQDADCENSIGGYSFSLNLKLNVHESAEKNIIYKNSDGATGLTATYTEGTELTLPTAPTKTGYTFGGWFTDKDCTTGNEITKIPNTSIGDVIVYGKWTALTNNVTLDLDGGSLTGDNPINYTNGTPGNLPTPTKTGYDFKGWYTEANGAGTQVTEIPTLTGDVTYYAHFVICDYKVTLLSGNTLTTTETYNNLVHYVYSATKVDLPDSSAMTKEGYTFGGWYTDAACSGTVVTEIAANSTGNKTFYAKWTKNA